MLKPHAAASGFTLVELLVGVTMVGVLLALGAPALGTYLQNSRVANTTATFYSGIQTARTEAIRRNVPVQFMLTNSVGSAASLATGAVPDPSGRNWIVRAASGGGFVPVETKAAAEGQGASGADSVEVAASGPVGFDGTLVFNGFGSMADSQAYWINITNSSAGACAAASGPSGPIRCRRIVISPVGRIAACDPAASPGDSRAC
ncbi:MAG TPA: GspH/FimT family pseudopilin [Caldimonas sp.]|jgi:type IV fimbrial biogenesis protein FimT|nr:GspH/FimT family pseudopilin [Caldimonas sp.]HEV7576745.1 GspH/FimT family pseudopilin [Caldimonas sp.]